MAFRGTLSLGGLARILSGNLRPNVRHQTARNHAFSAAGNDHIVVDVDAGTGVALLSLNRPPVNSFNLPYLNQLTDAVKSLEKDKCKGIIVTSALPKVFSAGLDLSEVMAPDKDRLASFWRSLQDMWLALYSTPLPTVAAINGAAPAGGCLVSLCCDYRLMAQGFIGLNETLLGIKAPPWLTDSMANTIGHRPSEIALQVGTMFSCDEALSVGLVDELCKKEELINRAKEQMAQLLSIPAHARSLTKLQVRRSTIDKMLAYREKDIKEMVNLISSEETQNSIQKYVAGLKK